MKKVPASDYAYAIGRVRALERYLISDETFREAADAETQDALHLFAESDPSGESLLQVKTPQELETALSTQEGMARALIAGLLLDKALEAFLEPAALARARTVSGEFHSELLDVYSACAVDMHNIKSCLRVRQSKERQRLLEQELLGGGFMERKALLACADKEPVAFLDFLEHVRLPLGVESYLSFLREAILSVEARQSFAQLEGAIDRFLAELLRPARYITFGPEPLIAYYIAKRSEIRRIRMIVLSKMHRSAGERVKEWLAYA